MVPHIPLLSKSDLSARRYAECLNSLVLFRAEKFPYRVVALGFETNYLNASHLRHSALAPPTHTWTKSLNDCQEESLAH